MRSFTTSWMFRELNLKDEGRGSLLADHHMLSSPSAVVVKISFFTVVNDIIQGSKRDLM